MRRAFNRSISTIQLPQFLIGLVVMVQPAAVEWNALERKFRCAHVHRNTAVARHRRRDNARQCGDANRGLIC